MSFSILKKIKRKPRLSLNSKFADVAAQQSITPFKPPCTPDISTEAYEQTAEHPLAVADEEHPIPVADEEHHFLEPTHNDQPVHLPASSQDDELTDLFSSNNKVDMNIMAIEIVEIDLEDKDYNLRSDIEGIEDTFEGIEDTFEEFDKDSFELISVINSSKERSIEVGNIANNSQQPPPLQTPPFIIKQCVTSCEDVADDDEEDELLDSDKIELAAIMRSEENKAQYQASSLVSTAKFKRFEKKERITKKKIKKTHQQLIKYLIELNAINKIKKIEIQKKLREKMIVN